MSSRCVVFLAFGVNPRRNARNGAEVRAYQNLTTFRRLGIEVLVVADSTQKREWDDDGPVEFIDGFRPQVFLDLCVNWKYRKDMQRVVAQTIDTREACVFCEHWHSLAIAPHAALTIYSCHDLESKLTPIRWFASDKVLTTRRRLYLWSVIQVERRLIRQSSCTVCVSESEARYVEEKYHKPACYLPIVASELEAKPIAALSGQPKMWFYGGSSATANKLMLRHLRESLFEPLRRLLPDTEFHQIGSTGTYEAGLRAWLEQHFVTHGFVERPDTLFQQGDICLIPYEHDTGFRTKLPELLSLGVIPAGYDVSFVCCPELVAGWNCIVGRTPSELASKLYDVVGNIYDQERLVRNCLETAKQWFSRDAMDRRFRSLLDRVGASYFGDLTKRS